MHTAQIIALAFALAGVQAAPQASYATAASSAAAALPTGNKIPGSNTLQYCEDPSSYLMTFSDISVNPLPPQP